MLQWGGGITPDQTGGCPETELGKKYEGYKYSISPLKQVLETVMVFQKRTKNKSILDDVFAFENGDETISPSIWAIDSGRVPTEVTKERFSLNENKREGTSINGVNDINTGSRDGDIRGRYPSQMFIDSTCASKIDEQSGELTSGKNAIRQSDGFNNTAYGKGMGIKAGLSNGEFGDSGGASRILHHIGYLDEELDLVFYSPKVSTFEREHGCGGAEEYELSNEISEEKRNEIITYLSGF